MPGTATAGRTSFLPFAYSSATTGPATNDGIPLFQAFSHIPVQRSTYCVCIKVGVKIDMYIQMYDELKKRPDDNPTLGIVLCTDTDEDIAKYSVMHGNEQLFASKYKLYLPTDEELRAELESQKAFFKLAHNDSENDKDE